MRKFNQTKRALILAASLVLATFIRTSAQNPNVEIDLDNPVMEGLTDAMQLKHAGDGTNRIFIAERAGTIKVFLPAAPSTAITFLNMNLPTPIVRSADGEDGLLSIAFHPQFNTNGFMYVYYTNLAGNLVVARYTASGNAASSGTYQEIITIPHPNATNHNGGEMHFGPDGFLYLSTGDGGGVNDGANNGQNPSSWLGKILRIDVNVQAGATLPYQIPPTNPISGSPVYALGLRNPFRWSFDKLTGDMWIGDVGQGQREEIDFRPAALISNSNFGWRCFEGDIPTPDIDRTGCLPVENYVAPLYTYVNGDDRGKSVIGGVVYRGSAYPLMYGFYIGTDYFSGDIHKILRSQSYISYEKGDLAGTVDIGEDEAGEIYAVKDDAVYQIFAEEPLPVRLANFQGEKGNEGVSLTWNTTMEEAFSNFEVEFSSNARDFKNVGKVLAENAAAGSVYRFSHLTKSTGNLYYRLKMVDIDNTFEYSKIILVKIGDEETSGIYVRPTVINDNKLSLNLNRTFQSVELVNAGGVVVLREEISGKSGEISIPLHEAASGLYIVRLADQDGVVQQKVLITD
ncbi:PQQ-dependent sugar dehydrogenase [Dyadobacter sp. CY343]|uniref:PQQ-dependent sugar dehydrogenase n=1 Tax=Dyadobacter sp. CY343 TaxID=2907299 RepID=UPI001F41242D|nr:PQQ-dependent sugar dehydrogenase [Dyadobacter sp. CY343]MCE7062402.1 PQQ-dependent sugar dehydrogenase [Dyadobacter sp. CY343]